MTLDEQLRPVGERDWLNPPISFDAPVSAQEGAVPVRVGMVDSGVNYQLAEIRDRLARDADGNLVGYDFWEMDDQPYDSHPVNAGFFVQRHGTRTASIVMREAPTVEVVPYRYPRPDMSRMHALIEHADRHGVAIIGMPLGSNRAEDWGSFASAARAHPHILFIVSAGNNGRDIDLAPVFPAALGLDNMLVVSSADDFVRPAEGVNWGRQSVDYLVPAERRIALDYSGNEALVSGSSYAVARVVALAARMKAANRDWDAPQLIAEFERRYAGITPNLDGWVARGYIADPLAENPVSKQAWSTLDAGLPAPATRLQLDLELLRLDAGWVDSDVTAALRETFRILAQCDISPGQITAHVVDADDYLRDLATGPARTVLDAVEPRRPAVVWARDTQMQQAYLGEAFGLGNTLRRPWLANSVWLMQGVDDAGIALAHELFHVLANSGAHVQGQANLMQAFTRPDSTALTPAQCEQARQVGIDNGLLRQR